MNFNIMINGDVIFSLPPDLAGIQLDILGDFPKGNDRDMKIPESKNPDAEFQDDKDQGTSASKNNDKRKEFMKGSSGAGMTRFFNHVGSNQKCEQNSRENNTAENYGLNEGILGALLELRSELRSAGIAVETPGIFSDSLYDNDKIIMLLVPGKEPKVMTFEEADTLFPDFYEGFICIEDFMGNGNGLNLYCNEDQIVRSCGEIFLTGPAVMCFEGKDGELWSLTGQEIYQGFCYYHDNKASIPLNPFFSDLKKVDVIQLWK